MCNHHVMDRLCVCGLCVCLSVCLFVCCHRLLPSVLHSCIPWPQHLTPRALGMWPPPSTHFPPTVQPVGGDLSPLAMVPLMCCMHYTMHWYSENKQVLSKHLKLPVLTLDHTVWKGQNFLRIFLYRIPPFSSGILSVWFHQCSASHTAWANQHHLWAS